MTDTISPSNDTSPAGVPDAPLTPRGVAERHVRRAVEELVEARRELTLGELYSFVRSEYPPNGNGGFVSSTCGAMARGASPLPDADRASRSADTDALVAALCRIEKWFGEFPETGQYSGGEQLSYAACYGSNGERDFMRGIARAALQQHEEKKL